MTTTGGHIGAFYEVRCLAATDCAALGATTQFAATARSESAILERHPLEGGPHRLIAVSDGL